MTALKRTELGTRGQYPSVFKLIQKAIEEYDLPSTADWSSLEELSQRTVLDAVVVDDAPILSDGNQYIARALVHVTLHYDEETEFNDSYPAEVKFDISDDGQVQIKTVKVDVSSFFM